MKTQLYIHSIISAIIIISPLQSTYAQAHHYVSEGATYPQRDAFFSMVPSAQSEKLFFKSEVALEESSDVALGLSFPSVLYQNRNSVMERVRGRDQMEGEIPRSDFKAVRFKPIPVALQNRPNAVPRRSAWLARQSSESDAGTGLFTTTRFSQDGFTVAFWTKWPYPFDETEYLDVGESTTVPLLTFVHTVEGHSSDARHLYSLGITKDRRVYVRRSVVVSDTLKDKVNMSRTPFWNLKFWNPEYADIDKVVSMSNPLGGPSEWFFVMIVQEKTQVRLHIGMPNGTFDCMYLDYGLEDQLQYKNYQRKSLSFFSGRSELYVEDLSLWSLPLCREEAFQYYLDTKVSNIVAKNILEQSAIEQAVIIDDDFRIHRDMERSCLNPPSRRRPRRSTPEEGGVIMEPKKEVGSEVSSKVGNGKQNTFKSESAEQIVIFPSPARSEINIKFSPDFVNHNKQIVDIALLDLHGIPVRTSKVNLNPISNGIIGWRIPQSESLPNGIYILSLTIADKTFSSKIAIDCGCR